MKPKKRKQSTDPDLHAILASLQEQLADSRKQQAKLMEMMNKPDPKDLTVQEVVVAYLKELPDDVTPEVLADRKRVLTLFAEHCGAKRISECGPLDLTAFFKKQPRWKSGWTSGTKLNHIRRAFNWARGMRIIREYPFHGVKGSNGPGGSPMADEHYRAILRATPPLFRRYLTFLRYTGCRPNEASRLRWSNIDWERSVAILQEHKTVKKTGDPRILPLHPVVMKLLRWMRGHPEAPQLGGRQRTATVVWLLNVLRNGPVKVRDVTRKAKAEGITLRMLYRARETLGVEYTRIGGWAGHGHTVYYLTKDAPPLPELPKDGPVFLNWNGNTWTKEALACLMARLRYGKIIKTGTKLYGLRHRLATEAAKKGINLVVIAGFMGHKQISTTAHYCKSVGKDTELLLKELQKIPQMPRKDKGGNGALGS